MITASLTACAPETKPVEQPAVTTSGFNPHIVTGENSVAENEILQDWIDTSLSTLKSPTFETNLNRVAERYPQIWVSRARDVMPTSDLHNVLHTKNNYSPALWWPETSVLLIGEAATRLPNRTGHGFSGSRAASTGAMTETTGGIELGRVHFARYAQGDIVERSCAINTMAHEISHTLSNREDEFWMHILDSGKDSNPPAGVFETSYLIGTIAQCTFLQDAGRIEADDFFNCLLTFSDPITQSRFRSRACNDFPDDKPITPMGRLPL